MEPLPAGLREELEEADGLKVRIFYLECLAQASYLISHQGNAFVVDPRRDVQALMQLLSKEGLTLLGILETHFHADFVSGHYEIGLKTGATIYYGPSARDRCKFPMHELKDNEVLELSPRYAIKTLHTPGHTMESVVYLLIDRQSNDKPLQAFTGDTLFIGSCGRPDLVGSIGYTSEHMATLMFNTLRNKIHTLPDDVKVLPAHGAGSPCGKNISKDLYSTVGKEKLTNVALSYNNEEEFVKFLTSDQPTTPGYFPYNVQMNTEGAPVLGDKLSSIPRLSAEDFHSAVSENSQYDIIDTRPAEQFYKQHIPNALNFPLGAAGGTIVGVEDGNFAMWVGTCLPSGTEVLLVNESGKDDEALQRLARIGYSNVRGVLCGGMEAYIAAGYPAMSRHRINLAKGDCLSKLLSDGNKLLDVRTETEYESNSVKGAINMPLAKLHKLTHLLNKDQKYLAFCVSGFRSTIAASLLRKQGYQVQDFYLGFAGISVHATELTTSGKVCPGMKAIMDTMME